MTDAAKPAAAIWALEAQLRSRPSNDPAPFQGVVRGREKRPLGEETYRFTRKDGREVS